MLKGRGGVFEGLGQGHPALDAEDLPVAGQVRRIRAFGMHDAPARRHPVELAGRDRLLGPKAVPVVDRAVKEPGDGCQSDMRMGTHIDPLPRPHQHRPELVEEDEGADHLALGCRQCAPHLEAAKIAGTGHDDTLDQIGRLRVTRHRIRNVGKCHGGASSAGRPCGRIPIKLDVLVATRFQAPADPPRGPARQASRETAWHPPKWRHGARRPCAPVSDRAWRAGDCPSGVPHFSLENPNTSS